MTQTSPPLAHVWAWHWLTNLQHKGHNIFLHTHTIAVASLTRHGLPHATYDPMQLDQRHNRNSTSSAVIVLSYDHVMADGPKWPLTSDAFVNNCWVLLDEAAPAGMGQTSLLQNLVK